MKVHYFSEAYQCLCHIYEDNSTGECDCNRETHYPAAPPPVRTALKRLEAMDQLHKRRNTDNE